MQKKPELCDDADTIVPQGMLGDVTNQNSAQANSKALAYSPAFFTAREGRLSCLAKQETGNLKWITTQSAGWQALILQELHWQLIQV